MFNQHIFDQLAYLSYNLVIPSSISCYISTPRMRTIFTFVICVRLPVNYVRYVSYIWLMLPFQYPICDVRYTNVSVFCDVLEAPYTICQNILYLSMFGYYLKEMNGCQWIVMLPLSTCHLIWLFNEDFIECTLLEC
jgi:uncharacterized membrane protein YccF (DUF307 family)